MNQPHPKPSRAERQPRRDPSDKPTWRSPLGKLPPHWQSAKALRNRPIQETTIAELLGVSRAYVSLLIQSAMRKLRARLGR